MSFLNSFLYACLIGGEEEWLINAGGVIKDTRATAFNLSIKKSPAISRLLTQWQRLTGIFLRCHCNHSLWEIIWRVCSRLMFRDIIYQTNWELHLISICLFLCSWRYGVRLKLGTPVRFCQMKLKQLMALKMGVHKLGLHLRPEKEVKRDVFFKTSELFTWCTQDFEI